MGHLLANRLRRLVQNPYKILGPYVREGATVLDVGPGMGFFSLPLADMVGSKGRVVALDIQPKMLEGLRRRAEKAGLADRIDYRLVDGDGQNLADLAGRIDFALSFYMVHEVPDIPGFMAGIHKLMAPGGTWLVSEPKFHVSQEDFDQTIAMAARTRFEVAARPNLGFSHTALFRPLSKAE
jgi:ubiquinone/menaquinone biosynthesis C-methylase UbiE